ncbi:MAG: MMPL family transporter [Elusimicrobiota bacterium]|jgi:predicted exporter|nr:MMPL family transporter [Elusimicrobiota bacterium]
MLSKFNFPFLYQCRKIYFAALCAVFLFFAFLFSRVLFVEDISQMLPQSFAEELSIIQNSPAGNKIFIVIDAIDADAAQETKDFIYRELSEDKSLSLSGLDFDLNFLLSFYENAPKLWNSDIEAAISPLISGAQLSERIDENINKLFSPEGIFSEDLIIEDPLNLTFILAQELQKLNFTNSNEALPQIISENGKTILLIFNYKSGFFDINKSKEFDEKFESIKKECANSVNLFYMGAPRYAVENNKIVRKDIVKVFSASLLLSFLFFIFFIRELKALIIYLIAPASIIFAASLSYLILGQLSGIAAGFSSVLTGLSVDYGLYMFFALKCSKESDRFKNAKKMFKPITVSAATSIFTFAFLFFSGIEVLKQISLLCSLGLLFALFFALFCAPLIFDCKEADGENKRAVKKNVRLKTNSAFIILLILFLTSLISFHFVRFNFSLQSLNTVSKSFERDRERFDALFGAADTKNAVFAVFGKTKEQALSNNEKISKQNKTLFQLSKIFPSKEQEKKNIEEWKLFWGERLPRIEYVLDKTSERYGLKRGLYGDFYDFLKSGVFPNSAKVFTLDGVFNPLIKIGSEFAFINILKADAVIDKDRDIKTVFVSDETLNKKIISQMGAKFLYILAAVFIFSFIILTAIFRKIKYSLLAVLPAVCGIAVFICASAAFRIEINILSIFIIPLLIGLGVDYGVLTVFKYKNAGGFSKLHPSKALIFAAVSTIIGFGSLSIASHKVLFAMGFIIFWGILGAVFAALFIIPSFFQKEF